MDTLPPVEVPKQVRLVPPWVALVLAGIAAEAAAAAPRLICYPVMAGDTVTALSVRLTRDPQSWRGAGFQILDPAGARFIAKAICWRGTESQPRNFESPIQHCRIRMRPHKWISLSWNINIQGTICCIAKSNNNAYSNLTEYIREDANERQTGDFRSPFRADDGRIRPARC